MKKIIPDRKQYLEQIYKLSVEAVPDENNSLMDIIISAAIHIGATPEMAKNDAKIVMNLHKAVQILLQKAAAEGIN